MTSPRSFAHYTVTDKIGAGGMGEVFRATDSKLGRDVALKMLPETVAQDPERLARFTREAQVLASLNHPGIAAVYGLEAQDDHYALAMELVSGPDLSERLEKGPLGVEEGLAVAVQLAEAIEAAHENGIIHRDLKPANIKLTDEGRVKVLDFGLAKALADDPAASSIDMENSPTLTANMTMGNVILGTAAYMSPEQARGTQVDKRADIWAYGVVVAEMLGGAKLFSGETMSDTLASVLKSEIDLDALPDELPAAVKRLLGRCLHRDPRQRLRDIGDARIVLQEVLAGRVEEASAIETAPANPWPLRITAAVAVLAVAVAGLLYLRPSAETALPLRKFEIPMDPRDPSGSVSHAPQISPDGRFLLYLSHDQIWVRDLGTTVSRPLTGTEGARSPFWSPDSEWLGYGTTGSLMKVDRSGGHSMTVANVAANQAMAVASSAVWNIDGTIFYTTGSTGMLKVPAQAGEVTMHHPPQEGEVDFHELCALPDGRGWVMVVHDRKDYGKLGLLTPDGSSRIIFQVEGDSFNNPVWSSSGHLLFQREEVAAGIWAVPFSLDDLQVTGDAFLVAADGRNPSVSADGTLVYAAGANTESTELAWFDRDGNVLDSFGEFRTTRPFPSLSPDESQILITANAGSGREIWLYDNASGNERRLTFDGLRWGTTWWHPDGKRFATYTDPDNRGFMFTLDGSEPRREFGPALLPSISPDGKEILISRPHLEAGFNFDIAVMPMDPAGGEERILVESPAIEWAPVLSPDGTILLYNSDESGRMEVYATTYPGLVGRWQVSRDGGAYGRWRDDGREIYFTSFDHIYAVPVGDGDGLDLGRPQQLFERPSTDFSPAWADGYDVTGDGQKFILVQHIPNETDLEPVLVVVQNWYAEFAVD